MRIAVWHNLPSGGGKRQLYYHVKGLIERGHHVESWCPDTADQEFLPLSSLIQENVLPLALPKKRLLRHSYTETRDLINALDEHCFKCAEQINQSGFDVLFANACTFLRTSAIAKYIDIPSAIYLGEPYRWFYEAQPELPWISSRNFINSRITLGSVKVFFQELVRLQSYRIQAREEFECAKNFDMIFTNSVFSRESIMRSYNLDAKVCFLGIDTDFYKPTGEKKQNFIVGVGYLYYPKGADRAIRAVARMARKARPDLVWIANGYDPAYYDDCKELAKSLKVNFIPKLNITDIEVVSLFSKAGAMLYTPRLEPFGLAPLEANACATVVIGVAEGGIKESIEHGLNGFLATEDDPDQIAELLVNVLDDQHRASELGLQARRHVVNHWSLEKCTNNIESLLLRLQGSKSPDIRSLAQTNHSTKFNIGAVNDIKVLPRNIMNGREDKKMVPIVIKKAKEIKISGWAIDSNSEDVAGGVVAVIGGKSFKAKYGLERQDISDKYGSQYKYSGFETIIPVKSIGSGMHELSVKVVSSDKKSFYVGHEKKILLRVTDT